MLILSVRDLIFAEMRKTVADLRKIVPVEARIILAWVLGLALFVAALVQADIGSASWVIGWMALTGLAAFAVMLRYGLRTPFRDLTTAASFGGGLLMGLAASTSYLLV